MTSGQIVGTVGVVGLLVFAGALIWEGGSSRKFGVALLVALVGLEAYFMQVRPSPGARDADFCTQQPYSAEQC